MPRFQALWAQFEAWGRQNVLLLHDVVEKNTLPDLLGVLLHGRIQRPTAKRHKIWSNDRSLVDEIVQYAGYMPRTELNKFQKSLVVKTIDKNGKARYTGKKKELKDSQILD